MAMDSSTASGMVGGMIGGLVAGVGMVVVLMRRKPAQILATKPAADRLVRFKAAIPYERAVDALKEFTFAQGSAYKLESEACTPDCIVLSSGMTLWSYGFYYPIYLHKLSDGTTGLEIGALSKAAQPYLIAKRHRDQCAKQLFAYLQSRQGKAA